jgi:hypothetical protein
MLTSVMSLTGGALADRLVPSAPQFNGRVYHHPVNPRRNRLRPVRRLDGESGWGGMLTAAAQAHVTKAPWAVIFPGLAIFTAVLGLNLLGNARRDALEPGLREVGTATRLLSR